MRSLLYEGTVWHERREPAYRLEHSVFYVGFDLEELAGEVARPPVLGHNRFNLLSLHDLDYDILSPARGSDPSHRGVLLTIPRILGYAFNPVSFLLKRGPDGTLSSVMAEVHNTWGERHVYDLPPLGGDVYRSRTTKAFYVSPFLESEGEYEFEIRDETGGGLSVLITEATKGERAFAAGLHLKPRRLSTANLLKAVTRYPLLNLKVIGAIHWHALRIWLRGAKFHPHPKPSYPRMEAEK
ncbi:MAG: DUF1365 domain-containing protein [Rubricoccaceae bacterium]|nr:DUF1365 domain-containing protein [Rubricoccaceae bacterium]